MLEQLLYSTRREFLRGTLGTLSLSATLPGFLIRTADAVEEDGKKTGRILVMLQMAGGNDGLNTIVPYSDDHYYQARPGIAVSPDEVLKLNDQLGMHPALGGLKELYDDGKLAIVQGVGYPNPNRSHFASMDIWHTADPAGRRHTGWLGRYFDNRCQGADPPAPKSAIALMPETPLALSGAKFSPLAFQNEKQLVWGSKKTPAVVRKLFEQLNSGPSAVASPGQGKNEALHFVRRATLEARMGAADVLAAAKGKTRQVERRGKNSLQAQLALVLQMIKADFPTSVYYVSLGGFDTHSNQANRHRQLLTQLGGALQSFMAGLQRHKLAERVLVVSFSEFGRRVQQNSSGGTDHGTAAPMFIVGAKVDPGIRQPHPSLARLAQGDLIHGCDFRRIYAAVLRDWLGCKPQRVLGRQFSPLKILA